MPTELKIEVFFKNKQKKILVFSTFLQNFVAS